MQKSWSRGRAWQFGVAWAAGSYLYPPVAHVLYFGKLWCPPGRASSRVQVWSRDLEIESGHVTKFYNYFAGNSARGPILWGAATVQGLDTHARTDAVRDTQPEHIRHEPAHPIPATHLCGAEKQRGAREDDGSMRIHGGHDDEQQVVGRAYMLIITVWQANYGLFFGGRGGAA